MSQNRAQREKSTDDGGQATAGRGVAPCPDAILQGRHPEPKRACELVSLSRDGIDGPRHVAELAAVPAILGEKDAALELLAKVSAIPAGPSYGELRLSPAWDSLREDPRLDAMDALLAPREPIK